MNRVGCGGFTGWAGELVVVRGRARAAWCKVGDRWERRRGAAVFAGVQFREASRPLHRHHQRAAQLTGAVVLVFQDGALAGLMGIGAGAGAVGACVLLLALCVAFALSMDYEMFLPCVPPQVPAARIPAVGFRHLGVRRARRVFRCARCGGSLFLGACGPMHRQRP